MVSEILFAKKAISLSDKVILNSYKKLLSVLFGDSRQIGMDFDFE